jgi:uncharacterized membrane protein
MIRKIAMLTAVVGALAGLGATSAGAMDEETKTEGPVAGCSSSTADGGTTCDGGSGTPSTPEESSKGIDSVHLDSEGGKILVQEYTWPSGGTVRKCTRVGEDAGTRCPDG